MNKISQTKAVFDGNTTLGIPFDDTLSVSKVINFFKTDLVQLKRALHFKIGNIYVLIFIIIYQESVFQNIYQDYDN